MPSAARLADAAAPRVAEHHGVIASSTITIGWAIIAEASLSFLGFGLPPLPSWGTMLSREGRQYDGAAAGDVAVALTLVVYCLNMVGDALRDLLDPRLRGGGAHRRGRHARRRARHEGAAEAGTIPLSRPPGLLASHRARCCAGGGSRSERHQAACVQPPAVARAPYNRFSPQPPTAAEMRQDQVPVSPPDATA